MQARPTVNTPSIAFKSKDFSAADAYLKKWSPEKTQFESKGRSAAPDASAHL